MKKIIALLLSCLLCLSLFAACSQNPAPSASDPDVSGSNPPADSNASQESTPADAHEEHNHVNYKGLNSAGATLEELIAAEGREPEFSFEAGGVTYYAYNNVTLDELSFSQVQASFNEAYVRISCTYSTDVGLGDIYDQWEAHMGELYGAAAPLSDGAVRWADHTGNYVTLTKLNETTVQLCFYLTA